jgi:CRP-like cAMP-binding protein
VPAFASIPAPALAELAQLFREETHSAGSAVVIEGEVGDRLHLIVDGRVEVTAAGADGPVILATLEAGELFGEIALLVPCRKRQATVTAVTPLLTLALDECAFADFLRRHREIRGSLALAAEEMLTAKFLKLATPFARVDAQLLRRLASRVERRKVAEGTTIVRQGEAGEECYFLRTGSVAITAAGKDGTERQLATLGAGSLFGEAALLTEAPRNSTVRASEPCELLVLQRGDLLEVMGGDRQAGSRVMELLRLRARPLRVPGILARHQNTAEGETLTILKDPSRGAYYRLSSAGWFVWQRLDGEHTLRDLALDYYGDRKLFAPFAIAAIIEGMGNAGFLASEPLHPDVAAAFSLPGWRRGVLTAGRILRERGTLLANQLALPITLSRNAGSLFNPSLPRLTESDAPAEPRPTACPASLAV